MAVQAHRFLKSRTRWIVFALLIIVGSYLLAVTPVRTYLDQRSQMNAAEARYELLADANKKLEGRSQELQSDKEIERLARERYELVPPGQQAYAVMPPPAPPAPAEENSDDKGLLAKVGDAITFWN